MTILYAARWDKGGNRQVIRTGCRQFDTQISALGQGNVFGSTITGWYIRPHQETECNGYTFPEGYLRATDLKVFQPLSPQVDRAIRAYTNQSILYKLFHTTGHRQVVHGYVWSDAGHNLLDLWLTGRHDGSRNVLTACLPYLVNVETLNAGLLANAMKYHADPTPVPPVEAVFRWTAGYPDDTPIEYSIKPFEDSSRRPIMEAAGYVLADKRWRWSDDTTFDTSYFFPVSMFDDRFERVN